MEIRTWLFSRGGKSRATSTPCSRQASRKPFAGRLMSTKTKLVWESVPVKPARENQSIVNWRASVFRALSRGSRASSFMEAVAATMPATLSAFGPSQESRLIVSGCPIA